MEESTQPSEHESEDIPLPQKIFDSIWFLAGVAIVFFVLSYIVWGMVDLLTIPLG
ncbi:MAG: hypothetical protein ABEK50_16140 [bacterium]